MSYNRATNQALLHVLTCGTVLSNLAFNMAQDQQVPESWRRHLVKRGQDWDNAIQAFHSTKRKDRRK